MDPLSLIRTESDSCGLTLSIAEDKTLFFNTLTMPSRSDIDAFMALPKRTVARLNWRHGLTKKDVQWWEWESAVELEGTIPEGTRAIVQWRPAVGAALEKYSCGLLYRNERVYAVDFDPNGQHTNKVGKGRPYFTKRFGPGTHEHTWSEDGIGYAEPLVDFVDFAALFRYFCDKANLKVEGGFKAPPSVQLPLLLL